MFDFLARTHTILQWGLLSHYAINESGKGALEEERGQKTSNALLGTSFL